MSLLLSLLLCSAMQYLPGPQVIQPRTLTSPSGEWTARLEPSSKFGDGPSHITVSRGAERLWEADVPMTLWEARLSDDGYLAGYAFSIGLAADVPKGEFIVAILAPDGRELLNERVARTGSPHPDFPPNPRPLGLFVQPVLDRFVVRVAAENLNRSDEAWWTYVLSTGEELERVHPKGLLGSTDGVASTLDARPIVGTPLTLVQWYAFGDRSDPQPGTRFVLVDAEWKPVWTLELPGDYASRDRDEADRVREEARERGGILAADEPGRFELRHVAAKLRVSYAVEPDPAAPSGWAVREVARAVYAAPPTPALERLTLRKLATVPLQAGAPRAEGPVRDVVAFDFDAEGHLRLVRGEESGVTLLTLDSDGDVLGEARVKAIATDVEAVRAWHWLGDERWLFTLSPYGEDVKSRAWSVDAPSGAAREIDDFAGPFVEAVQPAPGGGFVLFGHFSRPYTQNEALIAFDRAGVRRWQHIQAGYDGADSNLYAVAGLAVESDGTVVLLDNTRESLQVFGPDGDFRRLIDLAPALGGGYFTELLLLPDASWLVGEFHSEMGKSGSNPGGFVEWHRLDADRQLLESFTLRLETGAPANARSLRVDRHGRLWTTDGESLSVSDDTHVLRRQLGLPPAADVIEEPSHVDFDGRVRIAVVDRRSHAIHLFAPSGERERVLRTEPADLEGDYIFPEVFAAPDGRVFVRESTGHLDRHLEFSAQGERVGWVELGGDRVAFAPDGTCWAAKGFVYEPCSLSRYGAAPDPGVTVLRRPNADFYVSIHALSCGSNGAVSVLSSSPQGPLSIDRFSPSGEALSSVDLSDAPAGHWTRLSESGEWLLVSSSSREAILVSAGNGTAALVNVEEGAERRSCAFALSPDGAELWYATCEPLALHRYALPDSP